MVMPGSMAGLADELRLPCFIAAFDLARAFGLAGAFFAGFFAAAAFFFTGGLLGGIGMDMPGMW